MSALVYFVGTAGSGKSTLTYAFQQWMQLNGYNAVTVNLDPGTESLPYVPDIDIRDWLSLRQIMEEYNLGPNGAQVVCADLLALKIEEVSKELESYECDYFLIDTPGQIELFAYRASSRHIVEKLGKEKTLLAILFDPLLAKMPSSFIAQLMLGASIQFRFNIPSVRLLSKVDMLSQDEIARIKLWSEEPYELLESAISEEPSMQMQVSVAMLKSIEEVNICKTLIHTSAETLFGLEDLYNAVQQCFFGGEDLEKH